MTLDWMQGGRWVVVHLWGHARNLKAGRSDITHRREAGVTMCTWSGLERAISS